MEEEINELKNYYCSINTILNLNNNRITNLGYAKRKNDAINKQQLEDFINNNFAGLFVPLAGTIPGDPIRGNIFLNNTNIINIRDPINSGDAVNLKTLQSSRSSLVPLKGNSQETSISGPLIFTQNSTVINIADPKNNLDIINLLTLKKESSKYLALSGGTLEGDIDANYQAITGLKTPENPTDAVNLDYLESISNNSYLKLQGNTSETPLKGDLIFNGTASIYGLADLSEDSNEQDAVNLRTLTSSSDLYLPKTGGSLSGNINANNTPVINIPQPINDEEAVNLQYLNSQLDLYLPKNISKSMTGTLNLGNNKITDLASPIHPKDGVSFAYLKTYVKQEISGYIPLDGNDHNTPITGNLVFNKKSTATQFSSPINPTDAVNLDYLKTTADKYLNSSEGTLYGNLNMQSHNAINVPNPTQPLELVNVGTCLSQFDSFNKNYIPLSGNSTDTPITGDLIFNQTTTITGLAHSQSSTDAVNFSELTNESSKYLPLSGTVPLKGTITLKGSGIITQELSPSEPQDAVNLQTLNEKINNYLHIDGGQLQGNINLAGSSKVIQNATPSEPQDAVNLQYLNNSIHTINDSYIPLKGTQINYPITGNLIFDSHHTLTGLKDATSATEIVNLNTLNSIANKYLLLSGTTPMNGSIDANKKSISSVRGPSISQDAINLQTLENKVAPYLPLSGGTLSGNINMNGQKITNVPNSTTDLSGLVSLHILSSATIIDEVPYIVCKRNSNQPLNIPWQSQRLLNWNCTFSSNTKIASNNADSYYNIPNNAETHLNILQTGSYYLSVTLSLSTHAEMLLQIYLVTNNPTLLTQNNSFSNGVETTLTTTFFVSSTSPNNPNYITIYSNAKPNNTITLNHFSWSIARTANAYNCNI